MLGLVKELGRAPLPGPRSPEELPELLVIAFEYCSPWILARAPSGAPNTMAVSGSYPNGDVHLAGSGGGEVGPSSARPRCARHAGVVRAPGPRPVGISSRSPVALRTTPASTKVWRVTSRGRASTFPATEQTHQRAIGCRSGACRRRFRPASPGAPDFAMVWRTGPVEKRRREHLTASRSPDVVTGPDTLGPSRAFPRSESRSTGHPTR